MTTPRLGAPELTTSQSGKELTVNEQIRYIESAAGHFIFKDRDLATPPGSPADGDCYLVAASPTGAWSGQAGKIAYRLNTSWKFYTVIEGFTAWVNDENVFIGYDGAAWNTLSAPSGTYAPANPQIQSVASAATVTPTFSNDQVNITAQAAGLTLANPTGTAVDAWGIVIRIKDNGTARTIGYGTQYRAIGVTLPTTTVISKTLYLGMEWNAADSKWDVLAVRQEA